MYILKTESETAKAVQKQNDTECRFVFENVGGLKLSPPEASHQSWH